MIRDDKAGGTTKEERGADLCLVMCVDKAAAHQELFVAVARPRKFSPAAAKQKKFENVRMHPFNVTHPLPVGVQRHRAHDRGT